MFLNILCQCFYVCLSVCQCVCECWWLGLCDVWGGNWWIKAGKIYEEKLFKKNLNSETCSSLTLRGNWWIKADVRKSDVCEVAWETIRGVIRRSHVSTCLCPPDSRNKNNWGKYVIYLPPLDKKVLIIFTHYVQDIHCTIGHWSVLLLSKTLKTILVTVAILSNIIYVVFKRWLQSTNTL